MPGKYYEELETGQKFKHSNGRTVTEMDNVLFSMLTMNSQPLHSNQETALCSLAARPLFDETIYSFPAAQIEVADAEVGAVRDLERIPQRRQEVQGDVVKDAGHWGCFSFCG